MQQQKIFNKTLWILLAINILNFYDRQVVGSLTEPLRRDFQLSDTQIGLLGSAFTWLYAIVGLPLGRAADTWNRKTLLAGGVTIWSAMTAFAGISTTYSELMISRLGVAIGEAVCAPAAASWIGDQYPPDQRSKPMSIFMLGVPIGISLSLFLSGPIAQAFGWRIAVMAAAAPALLMVPAVLWMKEPARGASEAHLGPIAKSSAWSVLRIPTMWWIILSGGLVNFVMYTISTFVPALLSRVHHLSLAETGLVTGAALAVGGISGGVIAASVGDKIIMKRRDGRMLSGAITAVCVVPASLLFIMQEPGSWLLSGIFIAITYALLNSYYGMVYPSLQDIVPPDLRATAMAIYFLFMYALGGSFGPLITGKLSDTMAWRAAREAGSAVLTEQAKATGLHQAMFVIPVLATGLAIVLYAGSRTILKDSRRPV